MGYKSDYEMFSLDFEEFLWAKGYDDAFIEDMLEHMRNLTPFNEVQMSVCSSLFLDYCILGGMPAVVREFIVKGTFEGSLEVCLLYTSYPDLTVHLTLFHAAIREGVPQKLEHNDIRWITVDEIDQFVFCPADEEILRKLKQSKGRKD